ncbi:MAG: prepilin-type N-terminal cleavage/methylation domain-containing protein [Phycisphaerae bacterium]
MSLTAHGGRAARRAATTGSAIPSFLPRGFTLLELAVVGAIIAILAALAIPSLSGLTRGSSETAMLTSLRSLFASARARAAATQRYVAVRFQQDREGRSFAIILDQVSPNDARFPNGCPSYDPFCTYLTFVADGNTQPIALPRGVELAQGDLEDYDTPDAHWLPTANDPNPAATTFSVVFSPGGQLVRRKVHVTQRPDSLDANNRTIGWDTVFNLVTGLAPFKPDVVDGGMLAQPPPQRTDPQPATGSPPVSPDVAVWRMSQNSIWIYEQQRRLDAGDRPFMGSAGSKPYNGYIPAQGMKVPLNTYTGAPINPRR